MSRIGPMRIGTRGNRARSRPVVLAACLAALVAFAGPGWLSACSSDSSNASGDPCEGAQKGKCGGACQSDADCAAGVYCGSEGVCTADCVAGGSTCGAGLSCSNRGRCSAGGLFGSDSGLGSLTDASACVVDTQRGEGIPADIYIMNDQSQSMSCPIPTGGTRWDAMVSALTSFLNSNEARGMGVGIQYFGLGGGQGSCDPNVYAPADVEIAPLPGNAGPIINSLGSHGPSTYTPTPAAMEGAIRHARQWATANPSHFTAVVLATDGQPNLCGNQADRIGDVARIAGDGLNGSPSIPTYVIGIVGGSAATGGGGCNLDPAPPNKPDLDRVAEAGGTGSAFIVDAANGDTSAQFLAALNSIRGAAVIPCVYTLPASTPEKQIDPSRVNVNFTPGDGSEKHLLQAPTSNDCDASAGGWYYDDAGNPTKILLCDATCNLVKADARAEVNILLGCKTDVINPR